MRASRHTGFAFVQGSRVSEAALSDPSLSAAPRRLRLIDRREPGYAFSPLTYHDSWLSIDPIVGCPSSCSYCYMRQTGWTGVRPERILEVDELLALLLSADTRHFVQHKTVLSFGNHTDTFAADNADYFLRFIEELERRRLRNVVVVVTKRLIPDSVLIAARRLRYAKLRFCVSYSGLSSAFERGGPEGAALDSLARLRGIGLAGIHFWRPICESNGTDDAIRTMLDAVAPLAAASVYVGLKLTPELVKSYRRRLSTAAGFGRRSPWRAIAARFPGAVAAYRQLTFSAVRLVSAHLLRAEPAAQGARLQRDCLLEDDLPGCESLPIRPACSLHGRAVATGGRRGSSATRASRCASQLPHWPGRRRARRRDFTGRLHVSPAQPRLPGEGRMLERGMFGEACATRQARSCRPSESSARAAGHPERLDPFASPGATRS